MKVIQSRAPTRVDLAGGTLDLWPLYVFHPGSVTLNLAIDIYTRVTLIVHKSKTITLRSLDTGTQKVYRHIDDLIQDTSPDLKLLKVHAQYWKPKVGFELITQSESPVGGGIAASSSLNIALCGAFKKLTKAKMSNEEMIRLAGNLEAQVIQSPTGSQDYYPAVYGGLNCIDYTLAGPKHTKLKLPLKKISDQLTLVYTGRPHHSGLNNWQIFKSEIENDKMTHQNLNRIRQIAMEMKAACLKKKVASWTGILRDEYEARIALSSVFTSPEIERLKDLSEKFGADAIKICGAGGGGCVFLWSDAAKKRILEEECRNAGFQVLKAKPVEQGLQVRVGSKPVDF